MNPNFDNEFCKNIYNNINKFVATKTNTDTILVCGEALERFKMLIKSFMLKPINEDVRKVLGITKTEIGEHIENDFENVRLQRRKNKYNEQQQWWVNLCKRIAYDLIIDPNITDEKLLEKYDVYEERYITKTHHNHERNVTAIKDAIRRIRKDGVDEWVNVYKSTVDKYVMLFKNDVFKYTIDEFVNMAKFPTNAKKLSLLYRDTFCYFSNRSDDKKSSQYVAYKNSNGEVIIDTIKNLTNEFIESGIKFKLLREMRGVVVGPVLLTFQQVKSLCFGCRTVVNDFDIYTLKPGVLNLYDKPITHQPVELAEEWKTILEMYAMERDENLNFIVNTDKYNYIVNWFAYMLQKPWSRNKSLLFIVGNQGIGKNIFTNAIVKILGRNISCGDANIEDVCGNFNSLIENKKFIVINEVQNVDYADKSKN